MSEENVIYVGTKPVTGYAMTALSLLSEVSTTITLKARGRAISKACDVAEVLRHRFLRDELRYVEVRTDTEAVTTREGKPSNISSIEIVLERIARPAVSTTEVESEAEVQVEPEVEVESGDESEAGEATTEDIPTEEGTE